MALRDGFFFGNFAKGVHISLTLQTKLSTPQPQLPFVPGSNVDILGMVIPPLIGNPYNGYINPYYWVDDHPLLYGNNGSLDPSTFGHAKMPSEKSPEALSDSCKSLAEIV